jgi:hypothetical protein
MNWGQPNMVAPANLVRCGTSSRGATAQPTRQPLIAWDFDSPSTMTVLSSDLAEARSETCRCLKVIRE